MDLPLDTFLQSVNGGAEAQTICQHFEQLIFSAGFERWGYLLKNKHRPKDQQPLIISNYQEQWVNRYVEQSYTYIDPIVLAIENSCRAFQWSNLVAECPLNRRQQKMFREKAEFGLIDGIGIPFMFGNGDRLVVTLVNSSLSGEQLKQHFAEKTSLLTVAANLFHFALQNARFSGEDIKLTPREYDCVCWLAKGKSSSEIATLLNKTERTVNFHINNAKVRLNAATRAQLVAKALHYRLIRL